MGNLRPHMADPTRLTANAASRTLLEPIAKIMLRCGVTYADFAEAAKAAFVKAAGEEFGLRGRPANASRVSIITGLHRREVTRQRALLAAGEEPISSRVSNVARVLSGWHQDPDFTDAEGKPLELSPDASKANPRTPNFAALCRKYGGDIPWTALLKELKHVGVVEETDDGRLRVLRRYYMPSRSDPAAVERSASVLRDLATTLHHNLFFTDLEPSRFEGRATNIHITRAAQRQFRKFLEERGEQFLEEIDDWLTEHERDAGSETPQAWRVGIGLYQIVDD